MNYRYRFLAVGLCLGIAQLSFATEYKIDPTHSDVDFYVKHLVKPLPGKFKDYSGTFNFDEKKPEDSKVKAEVKVASIDTGDPKRDAHLKSPDFFDAQKFPTLKFVSKEFKSDGDKKYKMSGDLTMHGVTKPVTFDVEYYGETNDTMTGHRASFGATTKIDRKDFGINWNKALDNGGLIVGDEVTIKIGVEGADLSKK